MSVDINGYLLIDGLTTVNAGMCQWGFACKDGHEYFIKEFLSPKYPLDEGKLGPELTKKMRDSADAFFEKKREFYTRLSGCRTGNNMVSGQRDVSHWSNIKSISAGFTHVVGLREDGTVVATGSNAYGQCDVSGWTDIVAISAGHTFTVGLRSDGTVVATGDNEHGQCNVGRWSDIVAISAGQSHVIGLHSDGSHVAAGSNAYGQCDLAK